MKRKFILSLAVSVLLSLSAGIVLTGCGTNSRSSRVMPTPDNSLPTATPWSATTTTTATPTKAPAASSPTRNTNPDPLTVPSPYSFCGYMIPIGQEDVQQATKYNPSYNYQTIDPGVIGEEGWLDEYFKYIQNDFNFKFVNSKETGYRTNQYYSYYFKYTGPETVTEYYDKDSDTYYNLEILLGRFLAEDRYSVAVRYPPEITMIEMNARTSKKLTNRNNAGAGSGSSDSSSTVRTHEKFVPDCDACNGTGKCSKCGGDGYVYSSASHKKDRNCPKCNTTGKCTSCGGSGDRY